MGSKKNGKGGDHGDHEGCDDHDHLHDDGVQEPAGLTRNETLVWDALIESGAGLKAYEILDRLKEKGVRAPMTVYRALEGLEEKGLIHKLAGINAFYPCEHNGPHDVQVFLVCENCATAKEVELESIVTELRPLMRKTDFQMRTARLEAKGLCANCQTKAA
jgi:Fur family zinc uptake transcriptional regulator